MSDVKHPMQPLVIDAYGVVRFKSNMIVRDVLDYAMARGFGLNQIALRDYSQEDFDQFWQLIGYSTSGYGDSSIVSSESVELADKLTAELLKTIKK